MKKQTYLVILMILISISSNSRDIHSSDTTLVWVDGACGMCRERIVETAQDVRGVASVQWNGHTKILEVAHTDNFKLERLHYALASAGHDTGELLAPDPVYNALPACCKYRTVEDHGLGIDEETPTGTKTDDPGVTTKGKVRGTVIEWREGEIMNLPGTHVYWSGTKRGVTTDENGFFEIGLRPESEFLVFSFVGYGKDSVQISRPSMLEVELSNTGSIGEVEIVYKREATKIDLDGAFDVQHLSSSELMKCACCNLSESFETNPTVDASVTDAVTGTRQIEMLGLAGQYVQINRENMPHIRGLSTVNGLGFVPGSWISGIQINTGTGSVVNGFESITGQINVELKQPDNSEKFYLNIYGSSDGMMEANANTAIRVNEHVSTGLLVHGKYQPFNFDHNEDGFLDHPLAKSGILMNRWTYKDDKGLTAVFGVKGVYAATESGQVNFDHTAAPEDQDSWGAAVHTNRLEGFLKIGKVFPDRPYSSLGFQVSGMYHDQEAFFGRRTYTGEQYSLYANLIYMGILGNTNHQYRTGASFQFDDYNETLSGSPLIREEAIPGVFLEYTYNFLDKFTMVSGIRADYHSSFGAFLTPRLHLRFAPFESTVFRAMAGRGQRTPQVLAENLHYLASSRQFVFEPAGTSENGFIMNPETAWNSGVNVAREFNFLGQQGLLKVDYFYTWFRDQVIVNLDRNTSAVVFQQLDGQSYSHSFQTQLNYELFRNYELRLAYRMNEVKMDIDGALMRKAMTPRHRAFINMAYATDGGWMLDMTVTWQGMKRLPETGMNPEPYQLEAYSPDFYLWNAQVSRTIKKRVDLYIGAENILNFRQQDPIIDAANPFGDYFDASLIWGPVFGRKIYAGIRYTIR